MKPVLEELARKHAGRLEVRMVDLRDPGGARLAEAHRVTLVPTQILLDGGGRERFRHEGFLGPDAIEAELRRLGWVR